MARFVTSVVDVEVHAVGLDVDGVLRNTGYAAFEAACAVIQELRGNVPTFHEFVIGCVSSHTPFYAERGVTDLEKVPEAFLRHWKNHDNVSPYEDVHPLLAHIQSLDLPVFVVSSHPTEKLRTWLNEHNLHLHIKEVRGGSRDKEVCLRESCTSLGIPTRSMLYFGDWGLDMRAARAVGGTGIGVTRGYDSRNALVRSGAHHVIDHLSEAMMFLR